MALTSAGKQPNMKKCRLILDNTGIWGDIDFRKIGVEYHVAGDKGWIK